MSLAGVVHPLSHVHVPRSGSQRPRSPQLSALHGFSASSCNVSSALPATIDTTLTRSGGT
eukprot:scaffold54828_cov30-Tisochrysis_lutea.AAC.4